jgi:hypothetical protein
VQVKYRDTSGTNAGTKQVTVSKLNFDLTQGFNEQILSGSVRFKAGSDTFIDRNGLIYRNVDPATGSGTKAVPFNMVQVSLMLIVGPQVLITI